MTISDREIERADILKYGGSIILAVIAVVGMVFALNNYFLSIREHTAFKERIDAEMARMTAR